MARSGTEGKIVDVIERLGVATREQISKTIGFSLDYIEYLLNYLVKKGYLIFGKGRYSLPRQRGKKSLKERAAKPRGGSRKKTKASSKKKSARGGSASGRKKQVVGENPFWWKKEKKKK